MLVRALAVCLLLAGSPAAALAQPAPAATVPAGLASFDAAWQIIRDTHFDPAFNGVDWNRVRDELRPRAAVAGSTRELRAVIQAMLDRLGQSHFALLPSESVEGTGRGGPGSGDLSGDPGLDVRLLDGRVVVTTVRPDGPAAAAGVRTGWFVQSIDGEAVAPLLARLPASLATRLRHVEAWRTVTTRVRGRSGSTARVEFADGTGRTLLRAIVRQPDPGDPVTVGNLPTFFVRVTSRAAQAPDGLKVGVIGFNVWMTPVDALVGAAVDAWRGADGIILDLRGNPGGLAAMLMGISGYFLDEPIVLGTMKTRERELRFVANPRRVNAAGERVKPYAGPVAILVDSMTGSASECFAGGMQAIGRARVFGQPSMGQALPALFDRLPNGDVLLHAYGDFQTSRGTRLEGRGVVPDEMAPLSRENLLAGRDLAMSRAVEWIRRSRR